MNQPTETHKIKPAISEYLAKCFEQDWEEHMPEAYKMDFMRKVAVLFYNLGATAYGQKNLNDLQRRLAEEQKQRSESSG